jgi:hypothetical protein
MGGDYGKFMAPTREGLASFFSPCRFGAAGKSFLEKAAAFLRALPNAYCSWAAMH